MYSIYDMYSIYGIQWSIGAIILWPPMQNAGSRLRLSFIPSFFLPCTIPGGLVTLDLHSFLLLFLCGGGIPWLFSAVPLCPASILQDRLQLLAAPGAEISETGLSKIVRYEVKTQDSRPLPRPFRRPPQFESRCRASSLARLLLQQSDALLKCIHDRKGLREMAWYLYARKPVGSRPHKSWKTWKNTC